MKKHTHLSLHERVKNAEFKSILLILIFSVNDLLMRTQTVLIDYFPKGTDFNEINRKRIQELQN
ncbi:hypothetical protein [Chryseobacterium sp.]|uniref:hypothetical protein n=1 Tax=Chryseobacterium sp. TaxID=1871047 RepID=UPI00289F063D|nr:hypothetical protein [Chryseobacterium sp.]